MAIPVMELVPVESSNIEAIGYSEECNLLRVKFLNGSIYDYPGVSASCHALLMNAAESKGKFLASLKCQGVRINPDSNFGQPYREPQPSCLDTYDSDPCCSKHLAKADLSTLEVWACPKCGCEWRPRKIEAFRHWEAQPIVQVFSVR